MPLLACTLVVLRVALVGHAPDTGDVVIAALALCLWLVLGCSRPLNMGLGALLVGAVCAVPCSRGPWLSFLSIPIVVGGAACLVVGSAPALRRGIWAGLGLAGAVHGLVCATQRFFIWPDALARQAELELSPTVIARMTSMRPLGLSVSPDLAAAIGIAGLVGALALVVDGSLTTLQRRLAAVLGCLCSLSLVLCQSFGALVAVGLGMAVFALLSRSPRMVVTLAAFALGCAAWLSDRGMSALSTSAGERIRNWSVALRSFGDAPIFGHGFMRFAPAYLERRGPEDNVTRYAHSLPVQWLVETGVVGVGAGVVCFVVVARLLFSGCVWTTASAQRCVVVAGAVAVWSRGLIDYDFEVGQCAMLGALVLGTALAEKRAEGSRVVVIVAVVIVALSGAGFALRSLAPTLVIGFDPDVALRAVVEDGAPAEPTLTPFVSELAPAALLVARERLSHDDVEGARTLLNWALVRDPGNAFVLRLNLAIARAGYADVPDAVAAAHHWGVAELPLPLPLPLPQPQPQPQPAPQVDEKQPTR